MSTARDARGSKRRFTPAERFWAKVQGDSYEECWVWTACINRSTGYGSFTPRTDTASSAHRWAYESMVGPIPDGLQLDHLCHNRACVNPWHLEPVTPLVNNRRRRFVLARRGTAA